MKKTLLLISLLSFLNLSSQTFTKDIGLDNFDDGATSITKSKNGFIISGYAKDYAYFAEIDINGKLLWREEANFTERNDFITDIKQIGNEIFGCGYGHYDGIGDFQEFYFKYNTDKKEFSWVKKNKHVLKPSTIQMLPNGNYLITGDRIVEDNFSLFLMEINPKNGKMEKFKSWRFAGRESASSAVIHKDNIYTGGRYGLEKKISKYRGAISKFDFKFDEVWSNYYLNPKDRYLRNDLFKLIIDNNELISVFRTNNSGINKYYKISLGKQSLDGELIWAKEFSLEGYTNITVKDIKANQDGYFLYGYTMAPEQNLFVIKTDKIGNVVWSKLYGGNYSDILSLDQGNFMEIDDDYIYLIAQSNSISNGNNLNSCFMKVNIDGSTSNDCFSSDIKVKTKSYAELIKGEIFLRGFNEVVNSNFLANEAMTTEYKSNDSYYCFPKLATNDRDTILSEKEIIIDFLANDIVPADEKVSSKIISMPKYGTAVITNNKMVYTKYETTFCGTDSFEYHLFSEINGFDTAVVYVYSLGQEEILPNLNNLVMPEVGSIRLKAELENASYLWSTGAATSHISISEPGNYYVNVTQNNCLTKKMFTIEENPYSFDNVATGNITFLLDASISMNRENRLPILKSSLYKILAFMRMEDKISMINYSSNSKIIFDGVNATEIDKIKTKIESINSEGRSNIVGGTKLSFVTTNNNSVINGNNRIIFTTDGDISKDSREELIQILKKSLPENTYFTIFLFNDASTFKTQMQSVADAVGGSLYVITPENVDQSLLKELKAVRRK